MDLSAAKPWLKFYGKTPAKLNYPSATTYQMIAAVAQTYPDNIAYIFMGKQTKYSAFLGRVDAAARGLYKLGIRKGDRVTICMPNLPQAIDCFYALNRIGAIANMIHPLSAPKEIAFYLKASESKAILTLDKFYYQVAEVLPELENKPEILIARISEELPFPKDLLYPFSEAGRATRRLPRKGYIYWTDVIARGRGARLPKNDGKFSDCAAILYSGGTTGTTKGILLSNLNFNALAMQTIAASGFGAIAGMKMLSIMPIFHGFGLGIGIHTALTGGATCILVPQFSVKIYSETMLQYRPELIPGVPTLFEALLRTEDLKDADLSHLKGIFCGGDSLTPELKKKVDAFLKDHGCAEQIREGYGTTECVTASCLTPKDYAREGSIGIPFPDTYYKIVKPGTNKERLAGMEGEICVSGPTVMMGYLDNPDETAAAVRRHDDFRLWLHTGDLGHMDEDGFIYFHQRLKRMIVSSGYNIYPSQLENIIDAHEKVLLSCVIGVKDDYKGQKVRAYVVPMPGIEPNDALRDELMAHCARHIARYACPREIEFRAELPKTLVGKVAYRELEEEANANA